MIAIPFVLLLLYMARYYTLKHEYQELNYHYNIIMSKYKAKMSENEENNEKE
jgi:hypothetical protein